MHLRTTLCAAFMAVCAFSIAGETLAAETPCGASGVRKQQQTVRDSERTRVGALELISGGFVYVCGDGTLAAPPAQKPEHEWWRLGTVQKTWRNPLTTVCLVPEHMSGRAYEAWHNILGILAPYADNELNYATSLRRDGNLIVKKEVQDYGNMSKYQRMVRAIPMNVPLGMTVSVVHETNKRAVLRAWMSIGSCAVDTQEPPDVMAVDEREPPILNGAIVLRTDFLAHHVLSWKACETSQLGRSCTGPETKLVPLSQ